MTVFLVPYSYHGVSINGASSIDSQKFELPIPRVLSLVIPVAGGDHLDLNYGQGAKLVAIPFKLVMLVTGTTPTNLQSNFDAFFGMPPTGFYGTVGTFIAKKHGSASYMDCEAELLKVSAFGDANWYDDDRIIAVNIAVTFKPLDLFKAVI